MLCPQTARHLEHKNEYSRAVGVGYWSRSLGSPSRGQPATAVIGFSNKLLHIYTYTINMTDLYMFRRNVSLFWALWNYRSKGLWCLVDLQCLIASFLEHFGHIQEPWGPSCVINNAKYVLFVLPSVWSWTEDIFIVNMTESFKADVRQLTLKERSRQDSEKTLQGHWMTFAVLDRFFRPMFLLRTLSS